MKKMICLLLTAVLLISVSMSAMVFSASADIVQTGYGDVEKIGDSGMCGDAIQYSWNSRDGFLRISGTGAIWDDFDWKTNTDYDVRDYVDEVYLYGVETIGTNAFKGFNIQSINIPFSLKYINQGAFKDCDTLTDVYYIYGTESQWNEIVIADENDCLLNAEIHFIEMPTEAAMPEPTEPMPEPTDCPLPEPTEFIPEPTNPNPVCELQYTELSDGTLAVCGFENNTENVDLVIPSEHNGKTVVRIGESVFMGNHDIVSVTIPETITYIDRRAFAGCDKLEIINYNCINAYLYYWSNYYVSYSVFQGCNAVREINIGNNVESIPDYAFAGIDIENISSFNIPESIKSIGGQLFNDDVTINTLVYNAIDCEYIGMIMSPNEYIKPFPNINTVTIGKNVKNIPVKYESHEGNGSYCTLFADTNLSTVIFENGINKISGFRGCDQITEIIIPEGTEEISEEAFLNCSNLETVIIPKSVTKVGKNAFYNTAWLNNQMSDAVYINNTLYQYNNSEETEVIVREDTTTILDYAFWGMENLSSITLPDNLTSIGNHAFDGCSAIKAINIPDSVSSIGSYAFSGCTSLLSVHIGNRITIIPERCFNGCTNLEDINIGNNIETIGDGAFAGSGFVRVFVPDNVTYLGSFAFGGCSNLKEVKIGKGIEIINCGTFINCVNLEKVTFSERVKQILGVSTHGSYWNSKDFGAFENCSNLTSIDIPNGVEVIGSYVFRGCSNLIKVTLPVTLDSIGSEAFYNCTSLSSIIIPESVNTIGKHAFWNCPRLSDIYIFNPVCQIFKDYETLSGSATIHGYDNSTAQIYAGNYNRTFMLIEDEPTVLGDVDGDGGVSIVDATCIQRHLASIPVFAYNESAADTDGDSLVTIFDATMIQRWLAGLKCPESIGKPIS